MAFMRNRPPKVVMLIMDYLPLFSGHAIYLQRLIREIQEVGTEVTILTPDFYRLAQCEILNGVEVRRFHFHPTESRWGLKVALRVMAYLISNINKFNILHIHGYLDIYGLMTVFNKLLGKRTIAQLVLLGADDPVTIGLRYKFKLIRMRLIAMLDRVMVISKPIAASYLQAELPEEKLVYIPQGVDTQVFRPASDKEKLLLRSEFGLLPHKRIVTFVGGVIRRKGVDLLIQAWKSIGQLYPDALLLIVGPDNFNEDDVNKVELNAFVCMIKDQVRDNGLNVRFTGRTNQVETYLKCSDVFVLPSRNEGFGNVILEAMACGIPPVISYMDGVSSETVQHGVDGLIVHDVEQLAESVSRLIEDSEYAARMGRNAREKAVRYFALDGIATKYNELYKGLCNQAMGRW